MPSSILLLTAGGTPFLQKHSVRLGGVRAWYYSRPTSQYTCRPPCPSWKPSRASVSVPPPPPLQVRMTSSDQLRSDQLSRSLGALIVFPKSNSGRRPALYVNDLAGPGLTIETPAGVPPPSLPPSALVLQQTIHHAPPTSAF